MSDELVALLRRAFHYDPELGVLFWKEMPSRSSKNLVGQRAGSLGRKGYIHIRVAQRPLVAHRVIWGITYGVMPTLQIDHINHIKHDNRISNLREATTAQNAWNRVVRSRSLPKGVDEKKTGENRFRARIKIHGESTCLGYFPTAELAGDAYARAAVEAHQEFCCLPEALRLAQAPVSFSYS